MDDRHAQFLIAVADLCGAAALAGLDVEVRTSDGRQTRGLPGSPRPAASEEEEVDSSGWAPMFRVNDSVLSLEDVVACTLLAPDENPRREVQS